MQRAWWLQIGSEPRRRRAAWAQCVVDGLARAPRKRRLGQLGSARRPAGGSTSSLRPKSSRARRLRVVRTPTSALPPQPCGAPSPMRRQTSLLPQDPPRLAPAPARAAAPPASPPPVWRQLHAVAAAWTAALARAGQYDSFECGHHLLSGHAAQELDPSALATVLASRSILGAERTPCRAQRRRKRAVPLLGRGDAVSCTPCYAPLKVVRSARETFGVLSTVRQRVVSARSDASRSSQRAVWSAIRPPSEASVATSLWAMRYGPLATRKRRMLVRQQRTSNKRLRRCMARADAARAAG